MTRIVIPVDREHERDLKHAADIMRDLDTLGFSRHGVSLVLVRDTLLELLDRVARARSLDAGYSVKVQPFACVPDEPGGYDADDPKHPGYHGVMADIYDMRAEK